MFYKESIVTLIQTGRDNYALKTLMLVRGETEETPDTMESFNQFKLMVAEEKFTDSNIFSDGNFKPLVTVIFLRACFVLTFNYALKFIHISMTHDSSSGIDYTFILNVVHTSTVVAVLFTIDKGRRKHFLMSGLGSSAVLIVFGFQRLSAYANYDLLIFVMFVLLELFSAIGLGLTSHIYSTEAFPTPKKPASIAFTSICEFCLQIFFILWVDNRLNPKIFDIALLLSSGFILKVLTVYLYFNLPETKLLSIRKAKLKFVE
jgi:Sugar (and other) transporter